MVRSWLKLRDNAKVSAKEAAPELSDQLLTRAFAAILAVPAEIAIDAMRRSGPVNSLVRPDGDVGRRVAKALDRRHLNVIGRGRVKRHRAAVPNNRAGVGKESVGVRVALDR